MIIYPAIVFCGGIAFPGIDEIFKKNNISVEYNQDSYKSFKDYVQLLMTESSVKKKQSAYNYAFTLLGDSYNPGLENENRYFKALRVIYAALADGQFEINPPNIAMVRLEMATQPKSFKQMDVDEIFKQIGLKKSVDEASFLYDTSSGTFVSNKHDLQHLTPEEISKLDIDPDHAWWNQVGKVTSWKNLEDWAEEIITKKIEKKLGSKIERYQISKFRKVLFLQKIKSSGTSPKAQAKDALAIEWKIKWGNEVQTEPVANRLYLALGAKYVDLVYANKRGQEGLTLILGDPSNEQRCDKEIASISFLRKCLIEDSPYRFDIFPFIFDQGIITEDNVDQVLRYLPETPVDKYQKDKLIGRQYVTFKESSVKLDADSIIKKIGPATTNLFEAQNDRALRGLFLYNLWISNTDAKEDNNKAVFLENFNSKSQYYIETQHDMGASFGPLGFPGLINELNIDKDFLKEKYFFKKIIFDTKFGYFPTSWKNASYSDFLWFAKKIASIPSKQIELIVASSKWPVHIQKVFSYKMIKRQHRIAEIFGVTSLLDLKNVPVPNIEIDLSTADKKIAAAMDFGFPPEKFVKILGQNNIEKDILVRDGLIITCDKSIINNLLEKFYYPTGLSRRIKRSDDDKPLDPCKMKFPW
ncbi:MAG: hypothetical protein A2381_10055 [Bdellovibrionales bacterium RIFOXYB1_FULL_37_110]|nr:MAG: hypothetical protein A2417_02570 [Bdellovibrionales bacterium RIFOXYC1_FULL_37_79]OFZ61108.1 MAG: hypothetical protein A2381_10055 [Bdellovibrionales bacterium RIFOXYB1_FULL_37_110]OFZ61613.1 MAG: hypothetical protein A2577_10525 [Bdellovibrionales bacterium RIFOXYD1_FULL_36_51]